MPLTKKLLISGARLVSRDGAELEPGPGVDWTLHLWVPGNQSPRADFVIGTGSLVDGSEGLVLKSQPKATKVTRVTL